MSTTPRLRLTSSLAAGALGLAGLVAGPALAGSASAATLDTGLPVGTTSVTLFLRAPHPAALARLAASPVGSRAQRLARLARLVPSDASRHSVLSRLTTDGLQIEHETAWSVTASGPSVTIGGLFGRQPTGAGVAHSVAAGALPRLPAGLGVLVSGAYLTTGGPAAYQHHTTSQLTGKDFRNADTPAGVTPSTGTKDSKITVATLQLSTFPSSDLSHYATSQGLADPVAGGRYRPVTVDGGPSAADSAGESTVEVDLDQESILATAPSAKQQAYFAPNTEAGFNDVFANAYDDVVGNSMATAKNPHLVALSSSWGGCESVTGAKSIHTLEPILQSLVAAGVTVFASSGDDGIYDCGSSDGTGGDNSQADVDYPASSPYVVSTGGSRLSAPSSAPNRGHNWTERTWSCKTPAACQNSNTGTGGGGGGASGSAHLHPVAGAAANFGGFAMPVYQQRTLTGIYAKSTKRLVPDIAADADPASGFGVYTTLGTGLLGTTLEVGGTSLASPISAAQLANTLGDAGRSTGVGDIHAALYSALVKGAKLPVTSRIKPFRDVKVGQIGAAADKGTDPSVTATTGYDTTSGVGGVLWSALKPFLFDTAAPTTKGIIFRHRSGHAPKQVVGFRWFTNAGKDTLVLDTTTVKISRVGAKTVLFRSGLFKGFKALSLARGHTYKMTVVATDIGGHTSRTSVTRITIPHHR